MAYVLLIVVTGLVGAYLLWDACRDRKPKAPERMSRERKELRRRTFLAIWANPRRRNDVYAWIHSRKSA